MAQGLYNGPLNGFGQAISMLRVLFKRFLNVVKWFAIGSVLLVLLFRVVPPPFTALMVERKVESWFNGKPIDLQRSWRSWDELPDSLKLAVIAGEDQHFAEHHGFDLPARRSIPMIFRGSGDCTAVDWTFLGGSIANWSFISFAVFAVVIVVLLVTQVISAT